MRADNTGYLREAVRQRQADTRTKAHAAIQQMRADGTPITVAGLARAASISRSWLYTQPDLVAQIHQHQPARPPNRRPRSAASDASWQQRLETAHQRIRELNTEIGQLREQLAIAHGQLRAHRLTHTPTSPCDPDTCPRRTTPTP